MKTASLFAPPYESDADLDAAVAAYRRFLAPKGVCVTGLRKSGRRALVYVYRIRQLWQDLNSSDVRSYLESIGYHYTTPEHAIATLERRINGSSGFPHEIGLFLGYPFEDVLGFIENKGKNCKCCGYWKVYCNECSAKAQFAKFEKCKTVYRRLWRQGVSLRELTVVA